MRRRLVTLVGSAASSVLLAPLILAGSATPAAATSTCTVGAVRYQAKGTNTKRITYIKSRTIAPKVKVSTTETLTKQATMDVSVSATWGGSISASAKVKVLAEAKADINQSINVTVGAHLTTTSTTQETVSYPTSSSSQFYAVYDGKFTWKGTWNRQDCGYVHTWVTTQEGTWQSFSGSAEGIALCKLGSKVQVQTNEWDQKACDIAL